MSLTELLIALFVCEHKIEKLESKLTTIGAHPEKDIEYWRDKKEGIELLMEQTVMAINTPKKEANGKD